MTGRRILVWMSGAIACILSAGALIASGLWGLAIFTPALVVAADGIYQWVLRMRLRREIRSWRNG